MEPLTDTGTPLHSSTETSTSTETTTPTPTLNDSPEATYGVQGYGQAGYGGYK